MFGLWQTISETAIIRFEECAIMRHMVRYEKRAAGLEDAGDGVYICKVVVGLRALGKSRTNREDEVKIGYLELRRRWGRMMIILSVLPPSSPG